MPERIAIIDARIPNQLGTYRQDLPIWVTGARQTLRVGVGDAPARMIAWVASQARHLGGAIDLDLIAHGAGADHRGSRVYYIQLGTPGITPLNVALWGQVAGLIRKIRVYTCGTLSSAFPEHVFQDAVRELRRESQVRPYSMAPPSVPRRDTPVDFQHHLMAGLSRHTGAQVKYSLNTMVGALELRGNSQSFDTDRMAEPVFLASPDGFRRQLR